MHPLAPPLPTGLIQTFWGVIMIYMYMGRCKSWTLDWTVDWTVDRIWDRILDQTLDIALDS